LKRTLLLSLLAVVPVALMPLAAAGKIAPDRKPATEGNQPSSKYEVFVGYGYTGLNQVNGSRYGLQGANLSITRDWGKYFGLTADGAFYKYPLNLGMSSNNQGNPGTPSVDTVLFGPVIHAYIFEHIGVLAHALLGGEHTGGENMTPNISFAGGVGCGMEYRLDKRLALRATGDYTAASFTVINPAPGFSPHRTWSPRAAFGVVYRF
jgi:hypothetical protein